MYLKKQSRVPDRNDMYFNRQRAKPRTYRTGHSYGYTLEV